MNPKREMGRLGISSECRGSKEEKRTPAKGEIEGAGTGKWKEKGRHSRIGCVSYGRNEPAQPGRRRLLAMTGLTAVPPGVSAGKGEDGLAEERTVFTA